MGKIFSINISLNKGVIKEPVDEAVLKENHGIVGDAHSAPGNRQVSLLSWESVQKQKSCPKAKESFNLKPGIYAENLTLEGIDLSGIKLKNRFIINGGIILEVAKIGKECHNYCEIFKRIGSCIMPKEGIFARVIKGGEIRRGDKIELEKN